MYTDQAKGTQTSAPHLYTRGPWPSRPPVTMVALGKAIMTLVEVSGVAPVVPASTLCTPQRPDGPTEHGPLY